MKTFLSAFVLALGLAFVPAYGQYQPTPIINPLNVTQGTYVDANFHSVPYGLAWSNNGLTYVVFDPSTSSTDQTNCLRHLKKTVAGTGGVVLQSIVYPDVVRTAVNIQETRVNADFIVNSTNTGTTLTTIPFNFPTNLQTGGHYRFSAKLYLNAGTGGTKFDVGGTCSTSNFIAHYQSVSSTSIIYGGNVTGFLTGPSGSSTGGQTLLTIDGEMDVTNGGTFVIQFAQNGSNATNSTVLNGSTLTVTQIP